MKENDAIFAVATSANGSVDVLIGVPAAAWQYMRDGHTHNFDLSKLDRPHQLPVRIIMFGGPDQDTIRRWLTAANTGISLAGDVSIDAKGTDSEQRERTLAMLIGWVATTFADREGAVEVPALDVAMIRSLVTTLGAA